MSIASEHLLEIRELVKDHLAHQDEQTLSAKREEQLKQQIRERLEAENAALVAHYYTADVVQELAEETGGMVGDSLEMARFGKEIAPLVTSGPVPIESQKQVPLGTAHSTATMRALPRRSA